MDLNYRIGDFAVITANNCNHGFEIGEIVEIVDTSEHPSYFQASNGKEIWYLSIDEVAFYKHK